MSYFGKLPVKFVEFNIVLDLFINQIFTPSPKYRILSWINLIHFLNLILSSLSNMLE